MCCWGGVYGEGVFLILGWQIEQQKNTKIKYNRGLRWLLFHIFHATTNQKLAGVTKGGWDRPRSHKRTIRELDGNNKPLAEGNNNNNNNVGRVGMNEFTCMNLHV